MKHKAPLLAVALRSSDLVKQTVPSCTGETKKRPPVCHDQCAYWKETGHGGMSAPIAERHQKGQRSSIDPIKKGTSLGWPSKTFLAWPEQNQSREDRAP